MAYAATSIKLKDGQRAQRKTLITAARWTVGTGQETQILGARTEDSSIEFNPEITTSTDILGITHTDVEKTEPQQSFDPMYIMGGSPLHEYLTEVALRNEIDKFNGVFDLYIITAYINDGTTSAEPGNYFAVKHTGCSIIPQSFGGDSYVNMPIEVHFSNDITEGSVDSLTDEFVFSAKPTT